MSFSYPSSTAPGAVDSSRISPANPTRLSSANTLAPLLNLNVNLPSRPQQFQTQHQSPSRHSSPHRYSNAPNTQALPNMAAPMGAGAPPPGQYYHPQPSMVQPPQHMHAGSDPNQHMRYPLPASPDVRMLAGGRHKKEIKRRTKTGCLTCRKRRIKCDEAHPICRNCTKSKRECLGYDPIFKAAPGPAAIQPAPTSGQSLQGHSAAPPYHPAPHGYMPAAPQPYPHGPAAVAGSVGSSAEPYEYIPAIDPALEGGSQMMIPPSMYDGTLEKDTSAKPAMIQNLLNVGGYPPPPIPIPTNLPPSTREDIRQVYSSIYAPAMDKFFETRWFTTRGLTHLLTDLLLCEKWALLLSRFNITARENFHENAVTQSLEAHIIWDSLLLCRQVSSSIIDSADQTASLDVDEGVHDAARRLDVFEKLVTNTFLDPQALEPFPTLPQPRNGTSLEDQLRYRELEFWRQIARFLTLRREKDIPADNPQGLKPATEQDIDNCLDLCRAVLDARENRDVLFSIAISRHVGQQLMDGTAQEPKGDATSAISQADDDKSPRNQFNVARQFIAAEAYQRGTTQVVQRLCGVAVQSWRVR